MGCSAKPLPPSKSGVGADNSNGPKDPPPEEGQPVGRSASTILADAKPEAIDKQTDGAEGDDIKGHHQDTRKLAEDFSGGNYHLGHGMPPNDSGWGWSLRSFHLFNQKGKPIEEITHNPVVGCVKDRGGSVAVDSDDQLGTPHPFEVLGGPTDPQGDV